MALSLCTGRELIPPPPSGTSGRPSVAYSGEYLRLRLLLMAMNLPVSSISNRVGMARPMTTLPLQTGRGRVLLIAALPLSSLKGGREKTPGQPPSPGLCPLSWTPSCTLSHKERGLPNSLWERRGRNSAPCHIRHLDCSHLLSTFRMPEWTCISLPNPHKDPVN